MDSFQNNTLVSLESPTFVDRLWRRLCWRELTNDYYDSL